jgi:two-component system, NtrC family, sensor kinase
MEILKTKIDKLNELAWDTRMKDSPKSSGLSKESIALARSINYKKGVAHGLKSLAFCLVRVAKNEEALPLLNEALSLFELLDDLEGQAVVNGLLAITQRNGGDLIASLKLSFKALELSHKIGFREHEGTELYFIGVTYKQLGNFEKALDCLYQSLYIFKEDENRLFQSYPINVIGSIYFENGDYAKALEYFEEGLAIRQASLDKLGEAGSLDNIGFTHFKLGNYGQAIRYCEQSLGVAKSTQDQRSQSNALLHLAEIYKQTGDIEKSIKLSNASLELKKTIGDRRREVEMLLFLVDLYKIVDPNKVLEMLNNAFQIAEDTKMLDLLSRIHFHLYVYYKQDGNYEETVKHLEAHTKLEKEFNKNVIRQKVLTLEITHKAEETRKEADGAKQRNEELSKLNKEIEVQRNKLENALDNLKATQAQLIQSEKMACLGEIIAGIAHEIQNPLNFVNNFSELNNELADEAEEEANKENLEEVKAIIKNIKHNEEKINHHGKRADAIVKGMLQHSRKSEGKKELTDINALCDEYLRLSYHGVRAKDKSFNVEMKTDFAETIGKLNIVPQDFGRVLLNLYNNAFYAVNEKRKLGIEGYEPTVSASTSRNSDKVEISIKDNGNGIPANVVDKIFQPFFTTKPTGQGTGLGLSLSYDIVKAHGGKISVNTKEGEFTEFVIQLPVSA